MAAGADGVDVADVAVVLHADDVVADAAELCCDVVGATFNTQKQYFRLDFFLRSRIRTSLQACNRICMEFLLRGAQWFAV